MVLRERWKCLSSHKYLVSPSASWILTNLISNTVQGVLVLRILDEFIMWFFTLGEIQFFFVQLSSVQQIDANSSDLGLSIY